ncbi:aminotransferase class IV [Castellaniella sp. S9]|uniref:aminotransferase class IV n=1 Tax=Castellaniella sp. S9 TaxID=2993652 RepID=UPI0022B4DE2C|nr:aminotransferase class IV [Castellaniella sp. S9]
MAHDPPPELIETMRLEDGAVALWPGHRARLARSAAVLGYPAVPAALDALVERACTAAPAGAFRLRLLVAADGTARLASSPLPATPQPVRLRLAREPLAADPFWLGHKSTHRPWFAAAQAWLDRHPEVFDVIHGNVRGELCEGSRSTVYVRDAGGAWLTPPLDCGLLPGVQRQALLDAGLAREARLSLADLRAAPALRVSNALRGWLDARLDADEGVGERD